MRKRITTEFKNHYTTPPVFLIRSPGRVNLMGGHTDYNDGFVMPMVIKGEIWMAIRPRHDRIVSLYSSDFNEIRQFSLDEIEKENTSWLEYIKGVSWVLKKKGFLLKGWEGVIMSTIPMGAGLSSSAALEMATIQSFMAVIGGALEKKEMAVIGKQAENQWVDANCGIMDQLISAGGKSGHALLIDCRSLDRKVIPILANCQIAILDTTTRRGLMDSAYNERRAQCESASAFFQIPALRDISLEQFLLKSGEIDSLIGKRVHHVILENHRTQQSAKVMIESDVDSLGTLMIESHKSLRDLFEVSSTELNTIVECAVNSPYCFGARMTGAGFGGCAVAVIRKDKSNSFNLEVKSEYKTKTGLDANIYSCDAVNGAEWMDFE